MKRTFGIVVMAAALSACGTIKSFDSENNQVEIKHRQGVTKCEEISHVYSGVRYDLCLLHSDKKKVPFKLQMDPLWMLSVDLLLSSVADTLALPYSIYQQSVNGNLEVVK